MIPLHAPTRVGSREVLLVDDLVLTHVTDNLAARLLPIATGDASLPLYVERQHVDALAELHPELPLYGLWQTLIATGRVPQRPGLYQIATDDTPHQERYLVREEDGAYSGRLTQEAMLDAFAPDPASVRPEVLDANPNTLRLPAQPIQTLQARRAQQARTRRQTLTAAALAALACLLLGTAADRTLHYRHAQQQQQAERLAQQTARLHQTLRRLHAGARIEPVDQSQRLDQLLILSRHSQRLEIPSTSLLSAAPLRAVIRADAPLPPIMPQGLAVQHASRRPDGSLHLAW